MATVGKGGDTDTNAAIAGALLGAADGLGAIPSLDGSCRSRPAGPTKHSARSDPRPMTYWPDDLPAIAEALLVVRPTAENVSAST